MLVANFFAGPGAGKSTMAARVFATLKANGVCAELVTEFAKDLTWSGSTKQLGCQVHLFGEQAWRMERLRDTGVEVIVTDSPLLLSLAYTPDDYPASYWSFAREYVDRFDNLNFFVERKRSYDPRGRNQTETEARELDLTISGLLETERQFLVPGNSEGAEIASALIMKAIVNEPI